VPRADDEGDAVDLRPGRLGQLDHLGHERGRQVVDHEPPEVLEVVGGQAASGPGQARDHDELLHLGDDPTSGGPPNGRMPRSFDERSRWWRRSFAG
jgi:hypothetical protein